ncbi:hypothetical protein [Pseudoduganella armeniaca]|uniref:STAS domain-containing protein n=1 Tax=Pseudoduganella armeniaca TaxID=2072590 RepID=A0A2R4CIE1_9BURK|nr:hypothetical protein [Pseudoduganella armeniaca]AVR99421.1 hypothetical protein C9I28_27080 [Pseudoduganella armeniaca]
MGLFTRFRKGKADDVVDDDEVLARLSANSELQRQRAQADLQRDIARATALKIDAIEAAMAADMFDDPEPAFRRPPRPAPMPQEQDGNTLPLLDGAVTELLGDEDIPAEAAAAERAPVVEEAALLYAGGDSGAARQLLVAAVAEDGRATGTRDRTAWWMLFDLYHVQGEQDAFDDLAIDYASTFETSPPMWQPPPAGAEGYSGIAPTVQFSGVLDERAQPQAERLRAVAEAAVLRVDFSRVQAVTPAGCGPVLDALRAVPPQRELQLAGAEELVAQLRALLDVGRRDEGEAPWLLLLELLRLLNREKDFEETAMDYCVTFEMSPPQFVAPGNVASTPRQASGPTADRYLLPQVIEGDSQALLAAIRAYAGQATTLVFDCSHLVRIDLTAGGQWLACLRELAQQGPRRIELRELNHLAAALLRLLGFADVARLFPHRY